MKAEANYFAHSEVTARRALALLQNDCAILYSRLTCPCGDFILPRTCIVFLCNKPCQAAYPIAAHLWLAAIGVVDAHGVVYIALWRQCKYNL